MGRGQASRRIRSGRSKRMERKEEGKLSRRRIVPPFIDGADPPRLMELPTIEEHPLYHRPRSRRGTITGLSAGRFSHEPGPRLEPPTPPSLSPSHAVSRCAPTMQQVCLWRADPGRRGLAAPGRIGLGPPVFHFSAIAVHGRLHLPRRARIGGEGERERGGGTRILRWLSRKVDSGRGRQNGTTASTPGGEVGNSAYGEQR